jgi:hypothetical protein
MYLLFDSLNSMIYIYGFITKICGSMSARQEYLFKVTLVSYQGDMLHATQFFVCFFIQML